MNNSPNATKDIISVIIKTSCSESVAELEKNTENNSETAKKKTRNYARKRTNVSDTLLTASENASSTSDSESNVDIETKKISDGPLSSKIPKIFENTSVEGLIISSDDEITLLKANPIPCEIEDNIPTKKKQFARKRTTCSEEQKISSGDSNESFEISKTPRTKQQARKSTASRKQVKIIEEDVEDGVKSDTNECEIIESPKPRKKIIASSFAHSSCRQHSRAVRKPTARKRTTVLDDEKVTESDPDEIEIIEAPKAEKKITLNDVLCSSYDKLSTTNRKSGDNLTLSAPLVKKMTDDL